MLIHMKDLVKAIALITQECPNHKIVRGRYLCPDLILPRHQISRTCVHSAEMIGMN